MTRSHTLPLSAAAMALGATGLAAQPLCRFVPNATNVVLNTELTQVSPQGCPPYAITGGVFTFLDVHIPAGVTVRGTGANPMVWVVLGDFVVDGTLDVSGGDGESVDTLGAANFAAAGGAGVCSGGDGGAGSPNTGSRSPAGQSGYGPGQLPGFGGGGGRLANGLCGRGSGGGGGSFGTLGDPYYKVLAGPNGSFVQQLGQGGYGCLGPSGAPTRTLLGGVAGVSAFLDVRTDNDFYGQAFDVHRGLAILGELPFPIGGGGGGGGGDRTTGGPDWVTDARGGGGGGGGGALLILARGKIEVGPQGAIRANGGNGGGGEQAGSNNQGGGGGGGSGGMLLLYAMGKIRLYAHGETYANGDYAFSLSADGGVGSQGPFAGTPIAGKYPPPASGPQWDANPSGGFGGLGLIQLYARPGSNSDGTNTVLDDNIDILDAAGQPMTGAAKQRYLAWRGFPNQNGVLVDDNNVPTNIGANEGDMRPSPVLQPIL